MVEGCLIGACDFTAEATLDISATSLGMSEYNLPLNVASGQAKLSATTSPVTESVPEPMMVLGLMGVGGFLAAKRKRIAP
ncbi:MULTISPECIES: PEP-CTERM sorting domain-containing protein [unclassified Coleofasciculus]|uniref:PEP-CTERM sorting domain-containing protein n=1 Tax=unclassified Coleofasciculus TaxID=2692782 RepID=UPI00187F7F42|nr:MULTISPECIES: PEP-CTERM sorting domain-containing protein [unclassified Coleofasciculus]MBE9129659.1 PEP-CTERM sorting domain-containing protein [Coleofasciculus sp. LEGE 07081]MBE9152182.1 PEP-CTERM sorting domain-containing protein [Coleofasciculus sp. LEGE 07092]